MKVERFCRPHFAQAAPTDTLREAAIRMRAGRWSCLPVIVDGTVIALITERDMVEAAAHGARPSDALVNDYMNNGSVTVSLDDDISVAATKMFAIGCRHLPVINSGRLVGMVSARDLLLEAARAGARGVLV
ncbi:MAG TPA: CBS domain-containing protein [Candidatus Dormibacteraeota bacterium]|nr:CBS domain-containing protein [Candidatus Dormibacteraeota bacterium]